MKASSLASSSTAFLHLRGPDGTPLYENGERVGITLYGPGTPEAARVEERTTARIVKRMRDSDGKPSVVPLDERRAQDAEDLADVTAEFHHLEEDGPDGAPLTGRALFVAVYRNPRLGWIVEQVNKFLGDWGKFTPSSNAS